jgi:uncharacterized Zn-finger protein
LYESDAGEVPDSIASAGFPVQLPGTIGRMNAIPSAPPDGAPAKLVPANAENRYEVRRADLPLSCPTPGMYLWNSHPRVYLPLEANGSAKCPYCGAIYRLVD